MDPHRILNVEHELQRLRLRAKKKDIDFTTLETKLEELENILRQIREGTENS